MNLPSTAHHDVSTNPGGTYPTELPAPTWGPHGWADPATAHHAAPPRTDGRLVAAGIVQMVTSGVLACISLIMGAVVFRNWRAHREIVDSFGDVGRFGADYTAMFVVVAVLAVVAAAFVASGVGCVRGRQWGRVATIVFAGLAFMLYGSGVVLGNPIDGVTILALAWFGTSTALAAFGTPHR